MLNLWKPLALVSTGTLVVLISCGGGTASGPGVAPAGAQGQPHMEAAWQHLKAARQELELAEHNKGGHREKAKELTDAAIAEVDKGIHFAE